MIAKSFPYFFLILILLSSSVFAQNGISGDKVWQVADESSLSRRSDQQYPLPDNYKTFNLNKSALEETLNAAPLEFTDAARNNEVILTMPMPDGTYQRFRIQKSPIVEEGLAVKYPELGKTYTGQGIDDPTATARFDFLPSGFHSMILSSRGSVYIDPYAKNDTSGYISFFKRDAHRNGNFVCQFDENETLESLLSTKFEPNNFLPEVENVTSGTSLRTYRLALAATQEYTAAVGGGTVAGALAAQVLIMNRVNGVYERDLAIRMVIIANNNLVIYTAEPDPYTNNNGSTMLTENTNNLNTVIGTANYDIGHVFSTGGGGVATLNGPCGTSKARGVTGLTNPIGDAFAIDYVAHEMGHQWGANHTFNGSVSNCAGGNRSAGSAYETGSGVTIMAYAGICGNQDLARNSIDTFHVKSLEVIVAYSQTGNGNTCAVTTSTGNTPPTVTSVGGSSFNIPKGTPFALTASGADVNNDSLTYDWQEYDLGAATTAVPNTDSDNVAKPIFRPYQQTVSGTRTFPALQYILDNANVPPATYNCGRTTPCLTGELLPAITRTMNFQVVARDNRANGGGINTATAQVIVDGNSGPFAITAPNTATTVTGGSTQTVTWNVATTTAAPVNAANVKISLSTDGGQTFPTVLAASTPNDGTQTVTIPSVATTTARIKVEAVGNIFFDINDANLTIAPGVSSKLFDFDGDNKADISVYRGGNWYLLRSQLGFASINFGVASDKTVAADYDGDGKTDVAVFRNGAWIVQNSSDNAVVITNWGQAGDIPMVGDYDGDGKADFTVFRSGVWYIQQSSNGAVRFESFGVSSDKPVVGNFDNDNRQDLAVFRNGIWYIQGSQAGFFAITFGQTGDLSVPADYDGDGKTDVAVFRSGTWYIQGSTAGFSTINFGVASDTPAPADFDGDGKADVSVFRSSNGTWYLQQSTSGFGAVSFGQNGDLPVPAQSN